VEKKLGKMTPLITEMFAKEKYLKEGHMCLEGALGETCPLLKGFLKENRYSCQKDPNLVN
jgi:hypothetical protein